MKLRFSRHAALAVAACLIATSSANAQKTKIDSVDALAHVLAAKLPHGSNETIYVALPGWDRQGRHFLIREKIGQELGQALSAAEPSDKVVTKPEAAAILSKLGAQPLDVYVSSYTARKIGADLLITTKILPEGDGFALTVEAIDPQSKKRYAKLEALLPNSPQLLALVSQPDVPIKDSTGTYKADVGGVGVPRCEHCPSPHFLAQAPLVKSPETVLIGLTVGIDGKTSNVVILMGPTPTVPGFGQAALEAIRSWKFRPAQGPDGKPVPVRLLVDIRINLL